jgi:hypothetical protein
VGLNALWAHICHCGQNSQVRRFAQAQGFARKKQTLLTPKMLADMGNTALEPDEPQQLKLNA